MTDQSELDRMTALAEKLRLALAHQREVNETLVGALRAMVEAADGDYDHIDRYLTLLGEAMVQAHDALAASREVK